MTDRFGVIERRLDRLEERIRRMEERPAAETAAAPPEILPLPDMPGKEPSTLLALVGRAVMALGGGFLIRALTEGGTLSRGVGVAAGLTYAGLWFALSVRGRREAARFFDGAVGIALAFPLLWEATARLSLLRPLPALAAGAAAAAVSLGAAVRQRGPALAWIATAGSVVLLALLASAAGRIDLFAAAAVALAATTEVLAYARRWPGPRWIAAAAADLAVPAMAAVVARPGGLPDGYRAVSPSLALAVALLLPLSTLAIFGLRTVSRRRPATGFEWAQSGAALLAGFGGAFAIARSGVGGEGAIAAAALASAAGFYAVAFRYFAAAPGLEANFHLSASLGLLMALGGGAIALPPLPRALLWGAGTAAFAGAPARFRRPTVSAHAVIWLAASAACGLIAAVGGAFFGAPAVPGPAAVAALAAAIAVVIFAFRRPSASTAGRILRVAAVLVAAAGFCAGAVGLLAALGGSSTPAALAAVRMGVLVAGTVLLAAGARGPRGDLRILVYAALALGALKLLLDDLPNGTPASRFAAFILYGIALLATPRLLRRPASGA